MYKILITGANGQLGSELKLLADHMTHFEFVFTDIDSLDITEKEAFDDFLLRYKPDFVINCAAYTSVDKAEIENETCYRINTLAPGIIASGCQKTAARLIHISTDYVFDGMGNIPYSEDHPTNPQGVYGTTKRDGELACQTGTDAIIIRTSWLYSSFGSNFVKTMIRLGNEKNQLKVVYDQIGTPTLAGDLAGAILQIISLTTLDQENWIPGIYHYSNEGVCSWYDFALAIHRFAEINCEVLPVESKDFITPAKRPHYSVLNKSKIKCTFGIKIPYWMDSLEACMKQIKMT
jgi:dTDP-4-dehydrorhamnose reductase